MTCTHLDPLPTDQGELCVHEGALAVHSVWLACLALMTDVLYNNVLLFTD